jgi:hypothetical protein
VGGELICCAVVKSDEYRCRRIISNQAIWHDYSDVRLLFFLQAKRETKESSWDCFVPSFLPLIRIVQTTLTNLIAHVTKVLLSRLFIYCWNSFLDSTLVSVSTSGGLRFWICHRKVVNSDGEALCIGLSLLVLQIKSTLSAFLPYFLNCCLYIECWSLCWVVRYEGLWAVVTKLDNSFYCSQENTRYDSLMKLYCYYVKLQHYNSATFGTADPAANPTGFEFTISQIAYCSRW